MEQREKIKVDLGVQEVDRFESYLGLPTLVGQANIKPFHSSRIEYGRISKVGRDNCCLE